MSKSTKCMKNFKDGMIEEHFSSLFLKATPPFLAPHIKDVIVEMSLRESLHLSTFYDSTI